MSTLDTITDTAAETFSDVLSFILVNGITTNIIDDADIIALYAAMIGVFNSLGKPMISRMSEQTTAKVTLAETLLLGSSTFLVDQFMKRKKNIYVHFMQALSAKGISNIFMDIARENNIVITQNL